MLSTENLQQLCMVSGIGILCWLMIRGRAKARYRNEPAVKIGPMGYNANAKVVPSQYSGTRSLGAPAEVLNWQVELHELGRELKGELDSKLQAVRSITLQYEQAAQRLASLIELADKHSKTELPRIVRNLRAEGWEPEKIARTIGTEVALVEEILG